MIDPSRIILFVNIGASGDSALGGLDRLFLAGSWGKMLGEIGEEAVKLGLHRVELHNPCWTGPHPTDPSRIKRDGSPIKMHPDQAAIMAERVPAPFSRLYELCDGLKALRHKLDAGSGNGEVICYTGSPMLLDNCTYNEWFKFNWWIIESGCSAGLDWSWRQHPDLAGLIEAITLAGRKVYREPSPATTTEGDYSPDKPVEAGWLRLERYQNEILTDEHGKQHDRLPLPEGVEDIVIQTNAASPLEGLVEHYLAGGTVAIRKPAAEKFLELLQ